MRRRFALAFSIVCLLILNRDGRGQGASVSFDPVAAQIKRGYFAQLPFERIDMVNGNLLLTFTDLVLPGNAGMDLRFVRTFNKQTELWKFGLDGVPMEVIEPEAPFPEGPGESRHAPKLRMADGNIHVTSPQGSLTDTDVWITQRFWRYTLESRTVDLPNGWTATYSDDPGRAVLEEVRDPYGNRISVDWEPYDPQDVTLRRPAAFFQTVGGDTREVHLTYENSFSDLPKTMTFNGRVWTYNYEGNGVTLNSVALPAGGAWGYDYANGMTVTTPQGGTVHYDFTPQTFPDDAGGPPRKVVSGRTVAGRDVTSGAWTFSYSPQDPSHLGSFGDVDGPQGLHMFFRHDWSGLAGEWLLSESTLSKGGNELRRFTREYRVLRFLPWQSTGTIPVPDVDTLSQGGQTYSSSYDYDDDDEDHHFADFHRPNRVTESGQLTRTTDYAFEYGFDDGLYLLNRPRSQTVTVGNESFTKSYGYESSTGFLTRETTFGVDTTYGRDGFGNRATSTDANDNQTSYTYKWGAIENTVTPEYTISRTINPDGTIAQETRGGVQTTFGYDDIGRTTSVSAPHVDTTITDYSASAIVVSRGPTQVTTTVDGFGRVISTADAAGVQTRMAYDELGQRVFQSYTYGGSDGSANTGDTTAFDGLGRPTRITHSDGSFIQYGYDGTDVTITDENGHATLQHWEAFGDPEDRRLRFVVDARNKQWDYGYNAVGSLTSVSGPDGAGRAWSYDAQNRLRVETHPESGTTRYDYYPAGNLRTKTDPVREIAYSYDGNNRLTRVSTPDGIDDVTFDYDAFDNRTLVENAVVRTVFDYDAMRLKKRTDTILGRTFETLFDYDGRNNLTYIKYPSAREVFYSYDNANRTTEVRGHPQPGQNVFAGAVAYHSSGNIKGYTLGNGTVQNVTFDDRARVDHLTSGPLDLTYGVDEAGNIRDITDARPAFSSHFDYDEIDRLISVTNFGARTFTYDDVGNRRTMTAGGIGLTYDYDGNGRLSGITGGVSPGTFEYDPAGNMTMDPGQSTYTYSSFNMMRTATVAGARSVYSYDGSNARTVRSTPDGVTWSIHGAGSEVLADYDATSGEPELLREYIYLGSRLVTSVGRGAVPPPPLSVRITSPNPGESFPNDEPLTLSATVTSTLPNDTVARVEFYRDGLLIGSATTSPYTIDWTSNLPAGTYSVIARVVMTSGIAVTSAPVSVRFFLVGRVTGVTVTPDPFNAGDTATVTVTGNMNLCGAVGLDFGDGDAQIFPYDQALGIVPFVRTHVWTSGGPKTLVATGHGNCRGRVSITVTPRGPHATITSPASGTSFVTGDPIPITATAGDDGGLPITRVDFYADSTLLGSVASPPYTFTWTGAANGIYSLRAHAINSLGVVGISAPVSVRVANLASVTVSPAVIIPNQPATVTVTGVNPCGALQINFGPGASDLPQTFAISGLPFSRIERWSTPGTKTITVIGHGDCAGEITGQANVVADNPPTVTLISPSPGTFLSPAAFTVAATANDSDGSVARVDFYAGTTLIGTASAAPYSIAWNNVPHGTYSLTAVATDDIGASTTSAPVSITVTDISGVTVAPASPHAGAPATLTVTGSASCTSVQVNYGDGTVTPYAIPGLPFSVGHTWTSAGTFTVTVSGTGSCQGLVTTAVPVVANVPPTVNLTTPAPGASYIAPATVAIAATAADSDGAVTRVDFYANGTLLGSDSTDPYQFTWSGVAPGLYTLTAVASDNAGGTTTSSAVSVTVTNLGSVTVSPASVATNVPATVTVAGVNPCGALQIDFGPGASDAPQVFAIAGLPFQRTESWSTGGTKTITVTGHGDCVGQVSGQATVIANNPPTVTLTSPSNGATFAAGSHIALAATANDSDGSVNRVEFYAGTTLLATKTAAPYTFTWVSPAAGSYSLTAQAVDNLGARTISSGASVTVAIAVTGVSASPASVVTGQSTTVTVSGSNACGAVGIDFGPGASQAPQVYAISSLPFQQSVSWTAGGVKTIVVTGHGNCVGVVSGTATVTANNPPAVTLTSPASGSTFNAGSTISFAATASDSDGSVNRVEFYAGTTLLATKTTAPYTFSWVNPANGTYSLTAQAVDNIGLRTISSAASITITNLVTAVSASPSSVVTGQSTTVTVSGATACGAAGIDFGPGASRPPQVYALSSLPYQLTVSWSTAGSKSIVATGNGNCGGQATTTVSVGTNAPPSITLTSPANGSAYTSGTVIALSANASDTHGISRVDFFVDGGLVGTDTTAPYAVNWSVPSGTRNVTATAYDIYGASAGSAAASVSGRDVVSIGVTPTSFTAGDTATVTVTGSSSCGAVTIDYGDGTVLTYAISGLPFSQPHVWASGGWKPITATGQGSCVGQASTWVYVNWPPSVTLTAPVNGNTYVGPATIGLTASAGDPDGSIIAVTFYANNVPLYSTASAPYAFTWTNVPVGNYWIWAVAYDNAGVARGSNVSFVAVQDPGPATVTSVVVSPQTVAVGQAAAISVYGTNPCGLLQVNTGDGNAPYTPIEALPYGQGYAWGAPGTYTVTITGGGNCHGQASTTVTVVGEEPAPDADFVETAPGEDGTVGGPHVSDDEPAPATPAAQTVTLTVNLIGNGAGEVLTDGLSCHGNFGLTCTAVYQQGAVLTLTQSADAGSRFAGWGGGCVGTTCRITLNAPLLVTAAFNVPPPTVTQFYHLDAIGSVRAVTDAQGALIRRHDYAAFGEELAVEEPQALPNDAKHQSFVGKERDRETFLDYFGARYYASSAGRFTTADPGHVGGNIFDPQSWNAYAYARNNPLRFIDPTGTDYFVLVNGGAPFWIDNDEDLWKYEIGGFSFKDGRIYNSAGADVGEYLHFGKFERVLFEAGRRAEPGVNAALALGAVTTAIPAAVIGGGALVAGGGGTVVFGGMGGSIAGAISQISNPRVRDALSALYQVTDRFRGGTAAAVQFTRETGRLVGGSDHLIKAADRMRQLEKILRTESLSPSDRRLAEYALNRLKELNLK